MHIISIDAQQMNGILKHGGQSRLADALSSQHLNVIPLEHYGLPKAVKKSMQWAQLQQKIPKTLAINALYFLIILLWTAIYYQTLLWGIIGIASLLSIPVISYGLYMTSLQWAQQKLDILLATPLLLIHNDCIYENLPQLRQLDTEINALEQSQIDATQAVKEIEQLILKLKEKLILLGESTNDQQIIQMETEKLSQEKIIEKAQELLIHIRARKQEQENIRKEIIHRLELQALRQQATSLTGDGAHENSITLLTEIELQATTMVMEMNQMQRELQGINLHWKTMEELDKE